MIKNYLVVAFRNILKHKFYSAINILGLSLGIATFLFITIFVRDELSYDLSHPQADDIYRMDFTGSINGSEFITALMSAPAAATMVSDFPEVTESFRFRGTGDWLIKRKDSEITFKEEHVINADPNYFTFWNTKLLAGDPVTCLSRPRTLVMDQTTASKIFGDDDPIGKIVVLDNKTDYEVTGVYEDLPKNGHYHYNIMLTMLDRKDAESPIWMSFNFNTYLKLKHGSNPDELEAKFPALIESKIGPEIQRFMNVSLEEFAASGNSAGMYLFPLKKIHLYSDKLGELETNGDIKYVIIFSAIGLFILILAGINFMNLATARSANRAKEVGVRKVLGAYRGQLIRQFIAEALLITFISTIIAVLLTTFLLPFFNELADKQIELGDFYQIDFFLMLIGIMLIVGLSAGSYPAFYLSKFIPVDTLKGKINLGFKSGGIRSILVVLQFTVSIAMIVGTMVVFNQLAYIQNKKLGFNKDHVIMLHDAWIVGDQLDAFKTEALRDPRLVSGTIASFLPVKTTNNNTIYFPGQTVVSEDSYILSNYYVDHDYLSTLGMELADGRDFSREFGSDSTAAILNESAVRQMGIIDPVGKYITTFTGNDEDMAQTKSFKIIGVVKDFHYASLKENIEPLVFHLGKSRGFVSFRLDTEDVNGVVSYLKGVWNDFAPGQPFTYSFLDERFSRLYKAEQKIGEIFGVFAFLAIFIACLGLFGLASFTAEQKRKEIGIRKVLGASIGNIVNKLSLNFIKLVFISFVLAAPLAYYGMSKWLDDFAYRTELSLWIFLVAGFSSAAIAWLTMGFQSWKAARANPVSSLRNE